MLYEAKHEVIAIDPDTACLRIVAAGSWLRSEEEEDLPVLAEHRDAFVPLD